MSARFGGDLPDKGLLMRLAAADPRWACGPVTPKDPALGPTALLIERGGPPNQPCAFAYKVRDTMSFESYALRNAALPLSLAPRRLRPPTICRHYPPSVDSQVVPL